MTIEQIFVEQAEYIETGSFERWNAKHPDEEVILKKLTQGGAKLISGPRGCGKTTLLLKAFAKMANTRDAAFPVYVNFKRSLSVEPLYKSGTDGTYWFNQWVILKIYQGIYESVEKIGKKIQLTISNAEAKKASSYLEMSNAKKVTSEPLSLDILELDILRTLDFLNKSRCVLLLDDAAHAFSPEQQRDFFDFFRQIKSKEISPKAAIYPGVTNYSSSFHVGHDAEQVDVWIKPDNDRYLKFMKTVIEARFGNDLSKLSPNMQDLIDLLCFASFGVPRALLNMIQFLTQEQEEQAGDVNLDFSRADVLKAIKQHFANTKKLFTSLSAKLPVYEKFIKSGETILSNSLDLIKKYNKNKTVNKQSVSIAIAEADINHEFGRIFSMFQYAGLCISKDELISRGEKGRFRIFALHYAGLIDSNALLGARAINIKDYVAAFSKRDAHEFSRTKSDALLGSLNRDNAFTLSLPPCAICNTPRIYEDAKFCVSCGASLTSASTYMDLLGRDISELPLTTGRIRKIQNESTIRKIKDILIDHEHKELLSVKGIGKFWAAKIHALAEEFVE